MARDRKGARRAMKQLHAEGKVPALEPRAATKHGLFIGPNEDGRAVMACACCPVRDDCEEFTEGGKCALERAYIRDRRQQLTQALEASGHDAALHGPLIASAVFAELRLARAMRAVGLHGELLPGTADSSYLEYQPVAKELPRLQAAVQKALAELCLTPKALREVGGTGGDGPSLVDLLRAAAAQERKALAEAVDAEVVDAEDEEADADDRDE